MQDPSAVDVTDKYETVFAYSLVTFILLDFNIGFTYYRYRQSVIHKQRKVDYTCSICFFVFFIFFGVVELIMIGALRISYQGQVCSGDYLKKDDPEYNDDTKQYYMIYEGVFVICVIIYMIISVVSFIIMIFVVNAQRFYKTNMESTYVAPSVVQAHSRALEIVLK